MHIDDPLLNIRPETGLDMDFLAQLYRSTREDLLQTGLPESVLDSLIAMQFHAQHSGYRTRFPDADYDIIESAGTAIGSLIVNRGADTIRLVNIALLPQERRRGHGRRLILALQDEALTSNKMLTLSVSSQNLVAQRLYATLEFTAVSNDGAYLEMAWSGSPIQQEVSG